MLIFPGKDVTSEQPQLMEDIDLRMNPERLPPLEVLKQAIPVGNEVFGSDFLAGGDTFYLYYEHPVLQRRKKLFVVHKDDLLSFLNAKIKPDRMEGLDVTVADPELRRFLICNHDGEMYLLSR